MEEISVVEDRKTNSEACSSAQTRPKRRSSQNTNNNNASDDSKGQPSSTTDVNNGREANNPFKLLIEAARKMQPEQFSLPYDFMSHVPLPGWPKSGLSVTTQVEAKGSSCKGTSLLSPRGVDRDANGLVPLPLKTCFFCHESCRRQPLMGCDFCPSFFHLDCLDPPLTTMPSPAVKWMCPLHVERVIEEKLLPGEPLLSQRLKLHSELSEKRIDHMAVQVDFLAKVKSSCTESDDEETAEEAAKWRTKKLNVPKAIKDLYRKENRSSLVPPLEHLIYAAAFSNGIPSLIGNSNTVQDSNSTVREDVRKVVNRILDEVAPIPSFEPPNPEEQEIWLQSVVHLQSSIANQMAESSLLTEEKASDLLDKLNNDMIRALALQRLKQLLLKNADDLSSILPKSEVEVDEDSRKTSRADLPPELKRPRSNREVTSPTSISKDLGKEVRARAILCPILLHKNLANGNGSTILSTIRNSATSGCAMSYRSLTVGSGTGNDLNLDDYGYCNFVSQRHACIYYDDYARKYELINYSEHGTVVDSVLYSCDFGVKRILSETTPSNHHSSSRQVTKRKDIKKEVEVPSLPCHNKRTRRAVAAAAAYAASLENANATSNEKNTEELRKTRTNGIKEPEEAVKTNGSTRGGKKQMPSPDSTSTSQFPHRMQVIERPVMMKGKRKRIQGCSCRSSASAVIGGSGSGWEGAASLNHGSIIKFGCIHFVFSLTNQVPEVNLSLNSRLSSGSNSSDTSTISTASTPSKD